MSGSMFREERNPKVSAETPSVRLVPIDCSDLFDFEESTPVVTSAHMGAPDRIEKTIGIEQDENHKNSEVIELDLFAESEPEKKFKMSKEWRIQAFAEKHVSNFYHVAGHRVIHSYGTKMVNVRNVKKAIRDWFIQMKLVNPSQCWAKLCRMVENECRRWFLHSVRIQITWTPLVYPMCRDGQFHTLERYVNIMTTQYGDDEIHTVQVVIGAVRGGLSRPLDQVLGDVDTVTSLRELWRDALCDHGFKPRYY